uniref:CSON000695 protein n=1 Tax=Culicoides sonorensis TaxID=179676 RepID=A0A336MKQ4_CULSO
MCKKKLFLVIIAFILPILLIFYHGTIDFSLISEWTKRLAELESNLEHYKSMYRIKQEDVIILSSFLGLLTNISINNTYFENLSSDTQHVIKNISNKLTAPSSVRLPSIQQSFLPHLIQDTDALRPAYLLSKGRKDVSIVLGIPSVKSTLDNLLTNMNEEEQNETLIVVFIAETDFEYVQLVAKEIEIRFSHYVACGLIEILSPSPSYYPSWKNLKKTLNDPVERVKWRSKQNLDFAYMMAYSQSKGTFYVQLEDDILAKTGFITIIKNFALEKTENCSKAPISHI